MPRAESPAKKLEPLAALRFNDVIEQRYAPFQCGSNINSHLVFIIRLLGRLGSQSGEAMKFRIVVWLVVALAFMSLVETASAQRTGRRNKDGEQPADAQATDASKDDAEKDGKKAEEEEEVKLPDDPRLVDLYRQFVVSAEKLGADYEKTNQFDKARACYEEVVRAVPSYAKGKEHLQQAKDKQATAERKIVTVMASADWQDTGLMLAAGKPVIVTATGFWDFHLSNDVSADGMEIPKELRDFNLGSLIGMIDDGNPKDAKPFFIGAQLEFTSHRTGRLLLRMYDSDLSDNTGKLQVTITSSFVTGGKKQQPSGGSSAAN
jgi:hypothetical protein